MLVVPQTLKILSFWWGLFGLVLHAIIITRLFLIRFPKSRSNTPQTPGRAEKHCCHPALLHRSVKQTKTTSALETLGLGSAARTSWKGPFH